MNTVPGAQSASLAQNLVISGVSIADVDAASNAVQITLSTTAGSLSLSTLTGLSFSVGDGAGDGAMTFTGTLTNINAALNNLTFHATEAGPATLTLTTSDQGATGTGGALSDSDTISVTVSANVQLSTLDGTNGFEINGETAGDLSGVSVSAAGDVNGDGFGDLLIGAYRRATNGSLAGASYVLFGRSSGFSANLDLSALNGSNGFEINGETASDFSGFSVSEAGDVNRDGFGDLLIGAIGRDINGTDAGASYVVFGRSSGFSANLNLSDLNGSNGFELNGETASDYSGRPVSAAGDVNGDGLGDLLIGAYRRDTNGTDDGASYVLFGRDFTGAADFIGGSGNDTHTGTAADEILVGGLGNDTLSGGDGVDVLNGGAGDDVFDFTLLDQQVNGGSGEDTARLQSGGVYLDLGLAPLVNIEAVDITGTGDNTLALTLLEVLGLSDSSNTLRVDGDLGDAIISTGQGWLPGAVVDIGGTLYQTYQSGQATLLVDTDLFQTLS